MYEKLSKNALYCMYASAVCSAVILYAILGAVLFWWILPKEIAGGKEIGMLLSVLLLIETLFSPYFRYNRYRYRINEEYIDVREGYLFVKRSVVPLNRLHKLESKRGPFDRFFHVAKVIVTSGGGDITISFLEEEKAEQIVEQLSHRINELAAQQRRQHEKQTL